MSLAEKLDAIRAGGEKSIPAETAALMHRATQELQDSGILERVIKPGELLPAFELPNQNGDLVSSTALLEQGPMILSVYRGLW